VETAQDCVQLTLENGIACIALNRPARRNAINGAVHARFREILALLESNADVRAVIISGNGGSFCSGQDLAERAVMLDAGEVDLQSSLREHYNPLIRRLAALPVPVIAAVNGVASGAGAALALTADLVLMARSAALQLAFVRVALGPDSGISWLLPRLVGQARALGMALAGEMIDAARAEQWGLVWRVVDDEVLMTEAETLARQLASGPRAALAAIKYRLRAAAGETLDAALDAEAVMQGQLGRGNDYREAVEAFIGKRPPRFA
jgi:2-(1,2-epoxy-1,2-dihydrophenyl)acetyl-CoA isomerase